MALDYQLIQLPLVGGLNQKMDDRARPQPFLDICRDVQFDELGGLQTRLPFGQPAGAIFGGGTIANARRIVPYGNELVLFTSDSVYSWNAQLSAWVFRGTHLAVQVTETPRFATTGDQIDGDRAELNGTVVFAWTEGTQVFAAALDKVTGSVLVSPTAVSTAVGRPRLVALLTKILLFTDAGSNNLTVRAIDPASPATAIGGAGSSALATNFNAFYDAVAVPGVDTAIVASRRVTTTSYSILKVTAALAVTGATPARTCDGPIAVSVDPTGANAQIVRANGSNIQGDLVTVSGLADVFTGQTIGTAAGTPVNQIAAAHRSVQNGGAYRCYAFWSAQEGTTTFTWTSKSNWVDTANSLGSQANFVRQVGIASRAFSYNGSVYVWLAFGGATTVSATGPYTVAPLALQNTHFLYRDDAFLVAKATSGQGGGLAPSTGRLPTVAVTAGSTSFSWCATKRRRFTIGSSGVGFAAREPVDVTFTFDSNQARRCARLGSTLYIGAGEILQYDGVSLVELGFHIYPWNLGLIDVNGTGAVVPGTYAFKCTLRRPNAQGETERSTTATIGVLTVTGNTVSMPSPTPLTVTHKTMAPPAVEFWRTAVNAAVGSPFFLETSNDPTALTNPNRYLPNDITAASLPAFTDVLADSSLLLNEANPQNGGALESLVSPGASIIIATDTRLFLAGVTGDPHRVWYSKLRNAGELAAFNDALTIDVPRDGGDITSIAFLEEILFVFRQTAIYALPGQGFDNAGGGQNFGPARIVSLDVGAVNHESVARTPQGLIFKSSKGWYLLSPTGDVEYVGDRVSDFDGDSVLAVNVIEAQHQVRILTNNRMLFWDYRANQWGEWTISDGVHACMFGGQQVYLAATGTRTQQTTFTGGTTYGADIETAWIKPADLQGAVRVLEYLVLGEYRGSHALRLRTAFDYQQDGAGNVVYTDDIFWPPTPQVIGSVLQVSRGVSRGRCEAFKVRITASSPAADGTPATTEAIKLTGLAARVGFRKTPYTRLPAAQKV